jgi:hypothetical protein
LTPYNILNIPNKFARDDRREKVSRLQTAPKFDNISFGSSRVYSINPNIYTKYLGGESYSAAVGTSRIEDVLGFLLLLERLDKLPKNIIIGLDFYSFNQNLETNKYFLKNDDLNFMHKSANYDMYFAKFLSIDAIRASYKTLKNFLRNSKEKPRFLSNGGVATTKGIMYYFPKSLDSTPFLQKDIDNDFKFIKTIHYTEISKDRLNYLQRIVDLAKKHNINTYFFITPLQGQLLSKVQEDKETNKALKMFKEEIAKITTYYDFLQHSSINDDTAYFANATHSSTSTGNIIMARIFNDKNITIPKKFGTLIKSYKEVK